MENKMISKQANNMDFSNEMFAEMDKVLKKTYAHVEDITKEPVQEPTERVTALSELTGAIVRCAGKLEEVGHPSLVKADTALHYIQNEFLGKSKSK